MDEFGSRHVGSEVLKCIQVNVNVRQLEIVAQNSKERWAELALLLSHEQLFGGYSNG